MSEIIALPICGLHNKAAQVPNVLAEYAKALALSRFDTELLDNVLALGVTDLRGIYDLLREGTVYQNDPPCFDYAQSLATSLQRQQTLGVFGDCGAYAVAFAALADRLDPDGGVGEWLLLGDDADPARHIVNRVRGIVVDATMPQGFGWHIPARFTSALVLNPNTGRAANV